MPEPEIPAEHMNYPTAIAVILIPFLLVVLLARYGLPWLAHKTAKRQGVNPSQTIFTDLQFPLYILGGVTAIWLASLYLRSAPGSFTRHWDWDHFDDAITVLFTITLFYCGYRMVVYAGDAASSDASSTILIQRIAFALVFICAGITVVNQLHLDLAPVFASLGVAGLAVALGLQETLQNYFAGVTMAADRPLRPGDFVQLESGKEGYVDSIGWRTTRIRPLNESTIIVPNAKLASSVVVNQNYPQLSTRIYVDMGVSYESDLNHVEAACKAIAREVMERVPGSDCDFEPIVRFRGFGDSNIDLVLITRSLNYESGLILKSELIKAIHARFIEEGIVFNYPVRDIRITPPSA